MIFTRPKKCGRCNRKHEARNTAKELTKAVLPTTSIMMVFPGEFICEECGFVQDENGEKI